MEKFVSSCSFPLGTNYLCNLRGAAGLEGWIFIYYCIRIIFLPWIKLALRLHFSIKNQIWNFYFFLFFIFLRYFILFSNSYSSYNFQVICLKLQSRYAKTCMIKSKFQFLDITSSFGEKKFLFVSNFYS